MPQTLMERQEIRYFERFDLWRQTEAGSGTEMSGVQYARVGTGIRGWMETGISVKGREAWIRAEGDNMFTMDLLHTTPEVGVEYTDWVRLTARRQGHPDEPASVTWAAIDEWFKVAGDPQYRTLHANLLEIATKRTAPPPALRDEAAALELHARRTEPPPALRDAAEALG